MFERRSKHINYTRQQTTAWLSWLAGKLVQHNQMVYYIERMQPDWLPPAQQPGYGLPVGLLSGLVVELVFGLLFGPVDGLLFGLASGLVGGLLSGLFVGLSVGQSADLDRIKVTEALRWSWRLFVRYFGLLSGLLGGLVGALFFGLLGTLFFGLLGALIVGMLVRLWGTQPTRSGCPISTPMSSASNSITLIAQPSAYWSAPRIKQTI
jgi:uncharacterized membrane protein YeaQ/YmgE (transglycosylase-associated protein family)